MDICWQAFEGSLFNGLYPLIAFLHSDGQSAAYRTEHGADRRAAAIELIVIEPEHFSSFISHWEKVKALSHPHLLSVFEYGTGTLDDVPVLFVVTEHAEDRLADVLIERPLTEAETREVAETVCDALAYLHGCGVVHGNLDAAHILANGDQIKLSAPRIHDAGLSPADDIHAFGMLLLQCLTQSSGQDVSTLPAPFREIATRCLRAEPAGRWSAARIRSALSGEKPRTLAPPVRVPAQTKKLAIYAALCAAGVLIAGMAFHLRNVSTGTTATPVTTAPPSVTAPSVATLPAPTSARSRIVPPDRQPNSKGGQYVIVASYNRLDDARKRATSLKARWPRFNVQVHSPHQPNPPHLVTIGANLSKEAAVRLKRKALAAGLPRDTYFQSFKP